MYEDFQRMLNLIKIAEPSNKFFLDAKTNNRIEYRI